MSIFIINQNTPIFLCVLPLGFLSTAFDPHDHHYMEVSPWTIYATSLFSVFFSALATFRLYASTRSSNVNWNNHWSYLWLAKAPRGLKSYNNDYDLVKTEAMKIEMILMIADGWQTMMVMSETMRWNHQLPQLYILSSRTDGNDDVSTMATLVVKMSESMMESE